MLNEHLAAITHLHGSVVRMMTKAYGEWQNLTPATPKPLDQSSPKFAQVITSGIPTILQNFIQMKRIRDFVCTLVRLHAPNCLLGCFWGVLDPAHSQDTRMDFDAEYVKRRGSMQGCAFSGSQNQNLTFAPFLSKIANFRPYFVHWMC